MAKLYFRYGVMGSSKSANALMVRYNYEERGRKALLIKPCIDDRDGADIVASRIGISYECKHFDYLKNLSEDEIKEYSCIIVDEAQFLTKDEVDYLTYIVDELKISVICYGLRTDFKGELFEGSRELFCMADTIEEIKTICWCGKKALFNARFDENGNVLKAGEQIVLGANNMYIGLCREHWKNGNLGDLHLEKLKK